MKNLFDNYFFSAEKKFYYFHVLICSIGWLGLLFAAGNLVGQFLNDNLSANLTYLSWSSSIIDATKLSRLIQYVLCLAGIFVYYFIILAVLKKTKYTFPLKKEYGKPKFIVYWSLLLIVNLYALLMPAKYAFLMALQLIFISLIWLILFLIPFVFMCFKKLWQQEKSIKSRWGIAILCLLVLQLMLQFYPYLFEKQRVANDFMDIPEITLLKTGPVDNTAFVNKNQLQGRTTYDPRKTLEQNIHDYPKNKLLQIDTNSRVVAYFNNHRDIYGYFPTIPSVVLAINQKENLTKYKEFVELFLDADRIKAQAYIENRIFDERNFKGYTSSELEFIKNNKLETQFQVETGHYFYHQYTTLGPVDQYVLGRPLSQIDFLYGQYNAVMLSKVAGMIGGLNFQNYIKALYAFYPFYYLLLILVALLIFRDIWATLFLAVLALGCLQFEGFEYIRYAPGFNPLRHFFDIIVLLGLYLHLKLDKHKIISLISVFVLGSFAVLFSREFGLFLFLSLWVFVFFFEFLKAEKKRLTGVVLAIFLLVLVFIIGMPSTGGADEQLKYLLLGIGIMATPFSLVLLWLFAMSAVYYFLLVHAPKNTVHAKLTWFLFFYLQAASIYFIWYPDPSHLLSLGSIFALFLVFLVWQLLSLSKISINHRRLIFCMLSLSAVLLFYVPSLMIYEHKQHQYNEVFVTHKVYNWDFKRAQFETTMDPAPFERAVALIQKYVPDQKGIYIISKYNSLLPFLAGKYNIIPAQDMLNSLVTQTEISRTKILISHDKPRYIFVDSDIAWPRQGDIYNRSNKFIAELSVERIMRLESMTFLFKQIADDYTPLEEGGLITVYERKMQQPLVK